MNNEFENDTQSKRNDFIDAAVAFVVSFGFFAAIFTVAVVIDVLGDLQM